jgi:amino acid permease
MNSERRPLIPQQERHFEISRPASDLSFTCLSRSTDIPRDDTADEDCQESKGTTVFQTALNITKLCMGTGTLALPFAAQKGGLVFNMVGLGVIVVWNYYSADCLLRCLDYLPRKTVDQTNNECIRTEDASHIRSYLPPDGTTTYGVVAWHAYGRSGLMALDLLMILLFVGLLIAYQGEFISGITGIEFLFGRHSSLQSYLSILCAFKLHCLALSMA